MIKKEGKDIYIMGDPESNTLLVPTIVMGKGDDVEYVAVAFTNNIDKSFENGDEFDVENTDLVIGFKSINSIDNLIGILNVIKNELEKHQV